MHSLSSEGYPLHTSRQGRARLADSRVNSDSPPPVAEFELQCCCVHLHQKASKICLATLYSACLKAESCISVNCSTAQGLRIEKPTTQHRAGPVCWDGALARSHVCWVGTDQCKRNWRDWCQGGGQQWGGCHTLPTFTWEKGIGLSSMSLLASKQLWIDPI